MRKNGKWIFSLLIMAFLLIPCLPGPGIGQSAAVMTKPVHSTTIYIVGDSTASVYGVKAYPRTGWGQVFQKNFTPGCGIVVDDRARAGRSSMSFIKQGWWTPILEKLRAGDYVFIQMGHNDEKKEDATRYTDPKEGGTYQQYLSKYIDESRSKGAIPILLTPVERFGFNPGGAFRATHEAYRAAMLALAIKKRVTCIDVTKESTELFERLGPSETEKLFMIFQAGVWPNYPRGRADRTHFTHEGAQIIAELVAEGVKKQVPGLAPYIEYRTLEPVARNSKM